MHELRHNLDGTAVFMGDTSFLGKTMEAQSQKTTICHSDESGSPGSKLGWENINCDNSITAL